MDWQEKLKNDFPKMFSELTFGFECGQGWEKLIRKLAEDIQKICDETGDQVYALQVKEKFGSLRFYVETGNEDVHNLINKAEEESLVICENCGNPGKRRGGSWMYTRCDECYKKISCFSRPLDAAPKPPHFYDCIITNDKFVDILIKNKQI